MSNHIGSLSRRRKKKKPRPKQAGLPFIFCRVCYEFLERLMGAVLLGVSTLARDRQQNKLPVCSCAGVNKANMNRTEEETVEGVAAFFDRTEKTHRAALALQADMVESAQIWIPEICYLPERPLG